MRACVTRANKSVRTGVTDENKCLFSNVECVQVIEFEANSGSFLFVAVDICCFYFVAICCVFLFEVL